MEGVMTTDFCGHCSVWADTMRPRPEDWHRSVNPNCPVHGKLARLNSVKFQNMLVDLLDDDDSFPIFEL